MADVILLFISATILLVGAVIIGVVAGRARQRRSLERRRRSEPAYLRHRLTELDDFIHEINQATTDDEIDSLESKRREKE
jgi:hypothetical protein